MTDTVVHPAIRAWGRLVGTEEAPASVEVVKRRRSTIYRLKGVGCAGTDIFAKYGSAERLRVERTIYEDILPLTGTPALHFYGSLEEPDQGSCWLFLEDAGPPQDGALHGHQQLSLLAQWLRALHAVELSPRIRGCLPDRGPGYYLDHLRSIRGSIREQSRNPAINTMHQSTLASVLDQCDWIAKHWDRIASISTMVPRAVVHGDLVGKNVRIGVRHGRMALLVFDWEVAGWGTPAPDLISFGFGRERRMIASSSHLIWPDFDPADLDHVAKTGVILWLLGVIAGGVQALDHAWIEQPMAKVSVYRRWMAAAIRRFATT